MLPKFLVFLSLFSLCCAYKILVIFPMPGKSHSILGNGYVRHLLNAGHEVTYICPFKHKPHPNLRQIDTSDLLQYLGRTMTFDKLINKELDMQGPQFFNVMTNFTGNAMLHKNVQALLRDPNEKFDLIIIEWMFTEGFAGLSALYKCPFIWAIPMEVNWYALQLIDERPSPAIMSDLLSGNLPPFSFIQRVQELMFRMVGLIGRMAYVDGANVKVHNEILGPIAQQLGRPLPPFEDVLYNASLILGNSHVSLGSAVALPQNYKPIGGYHINEKVDPLPDDIKKIMDNAKDGVIYFSMGSNLNSSDLPLAIKNDLLKLFGELKQTVIWKFEKPLANVPKNVHIMRWAPQPSILAHPNCRIFVSHGGILSTMEAIHFSKPIIGMPAFGDQFLNVQRSVRLGYAKQVTWSYDVGTELKEAIEEVLQNPKYTERVKELSKIYHDRPASPGAELVHWARHVIETGGAPHLRSPALNVPWYQKMYLDLALVVLAVLYAILKSLKMIYRRIFGKKEVVTQKKKKN